MEALDDVVFEPIQDKHEDSRRALCAVFNGDLGGFTATQMKYLDIKAPCILGNHYHPYREVFASIGGNVEFTIEDPNTKKRRDILLTPGYRLMIPAGLPHRAIANRGTVLFACSNGTFKENESAIPYKID